MCGRLVRTVSEGGIAEICAPSGRVAILEYGPLVADGQTPSDMSPIILEAEDSGPFVGSTRRSSYCLPIRPSDMEPFRDPHPQPRLSYTSFLTPFLGVFLFPFMTPDSSLPETK